MILWAAVVICVGVSMVSCGVVLFVAWAACRAADKAADDLQIGGES